MHKTITSQSSHDQHRQNLTAATHDPDQRTRTRLAHRVEAPDLRRPHPLCALRNMRSTEGGCSTACRSTSYSTQRRNAIATGPCPDMRENAQQRVAVIAIDDPLFSQGPSS
jgi:hypothetical protein